MGLLGRLRRRELFRAGHNQLLRGRPRAGLRALKRQVTDDTDPTIDPCRLWLCPGEDEQRAPPAVREDQAVPVQVELAGRLEGLEVPLLLARGGLVGARHLRADDGAEGDRAAPDLVVAPVRVAASPAAGAAVLAEGERDAAPLDEGRRLALAEGRERPLGIRELVIRRRNAWLHGRYGQNDD